MKIYDKTVEINDELKFELGCSIEEAEESLKGFEVDKDFEKSIYATKKNTKIGPFTCDVVVSFFLNKLDGISITPERYSYAAKIAKDGESKEETMKRCAQDIIAYVEQSLVGFEKTKENYFSTGFLSENVGVGIATDIYYDYSIGIRLRRK